MCVLSDGVTMAHRHCRPSIIPLSSAVVLVSFSTPSNPRVLLLLLKYRGSPSNILNFIGFPATASTLNAVASTRADFDISIREHPPFRLCITFQMHTCTVLYF